MQIQVELTVVGELETISSMTSESYSTSVKACLQRMLQSRSGDVKVIVEGSVATVEYIAHRCILSARSPVFDTMLSNDVWSEAATGVIRIGDIEHTEVMYEVLHFIYTDEFSDYEVTIVN